MEYNRDVAGFTKSVLPEVRGILELRKTSKDDAYRRAQEFAKRITPKLNEFEGSVPDSFLYTVFTASIDGLASMKLKELDDDSFYVGIGNILNALYIATYRLSDDDWDISKLAEELEKIKDRPIAEITPSKLELIAQEVSAVA